jgi:hypothetical protein
MNLARIQKCGDKNSRHDVFDDDPLIIEAEGTLRGRIPTGVYRAPDNSPDDLGCDRVALKPGKLVLQDMTRLLYVLLDGESSKAPGSHRVALDLPFAGVR